MCVPTLALAYAALYKYGLRTAKLKASIDTSALKPVAMAFRGEWQSDFVQYDLGDRVDYQGFLWIDIPLMASY